MGKMYFAKEETSQQILSAVNDLSFGGGGGFDVELAPVTNAVATNGNLKNFIKWKDPKDCVIEGGTFARWAGTKVVRKEGSAPTGIADGEVILDSKVKNAYAITPYEDTGLTADVDYYYAFFPYNDEGVHTLKNFVTVHQTPRTDKAPATMSTSVSTLDMHNKLEGYDYLTDENKALRKTVEVTSNSDGEIVAISTNPDVATVAVDGTTLTVTPLSSGDTTIVISQYEGTDFISPRDAAVTVTVTRMNILEVENLEQQNWYFIKAIIALGLAPSFWKVGDVIPITLNGKFVSATSDDDNYQYVFDNETVYAVVLGFDHNKTLESNGAHSMHFIVGKTTESDPIERKDRAFTHGLMNTANSTAGGWKDSLARTKSLASFYKCLPGDLQYVISPITKYTNNVGNSSADMSTTVDKIFLISEYERMGATTYADASEANCQQQYDYFKNGNGQTYYTIDNYGTQEACLWTRSPSASTNEFCAVYKNKMCKSNNGVGWSFAPCFAIVG